MTYLSTAEVAEIKGCSLRYVQQLVQNGKLMGETKDNAANNRTEYIIPLTALPQDLQLKWENQQRRSLGLEPVKKAIKAPLKTESTRLTLDDLTDKQRSKLYLWTGIIKDCGVTSTHRTFAAITPTGTTSTARIPMCVRTQ